MALGFRRWRNIDAATSNSRIFCNRCVQSDVISLERGRFGHPDKICIHHGSPRDVGLHTDMVFTNRTSVTDPPEKRDREGVAVWMAAPFGHSAPVRGGEGRRARRPDALLCPVHSMTARPVGCRACTPATMATRAYPAGNRYRKLTTCP